MRSQSLQVWRTKCLYLTQFGVSSRIFPTSTSPAAQHGPSGRATSLLGDPGFGGRGVFSGATFEG